MFLEILHDLVNKCEETGHACGGLRSGGLFVPVKDVGEVHNTITADALHIAR